MYAVEESSCQPTRLKEQSDGHTLHVHFTPICLSPLLALAADLLPQSIVSSLTVSISDKESHDVVNVCVVHFEWYEAVTSILSLR